MNYAWLKNTRLYFSFVLMVFCVVFCWYFFIKIQDNQPALELVDTDSLSSAAENSLPQVIEPPITADIEPITTDINIEPAERINALSLIETHNLQLIKALDGDSNAQYQLTKTLGKCTWASKPTEYDIEQTIDTLSNSGSEYAEFDETFFDKLRSSARECAPIYDVYEGKLLYNVRNAWLTEAAAQGNQFAQLSLAFRKTDQYSDLDYQKFVKQLVENAMRTASSEESMLEEALYHAVNYRVNLHSVDKSTDFASKQTSDWALRLVECRFVQSGGQACIKSFEAEHELSEHYFLDPELKQAKTKADILSNSILEGDGLVNFDIDTF